MKNESYYFQRAAQYNLLADYYKYINPAQHIQYYQKHIKYLNKAMLQNRMFSRINAVHVRFLNAAKSHEKIDIYTNGRQLIKDLPFEDVTSYYTLHNGKHHIDIYPAGTQVSTIINKNISFEASQAYTLAAIATNDKLQLLPFVDLPHITSQDAHVKFIHLSSQYPTVNVSFRNGDTLFENINYKKSSEYKVVEPMTTHLDVIDSETKTVIQTIENVTFSPSKASSIFFIDSKIVIA